MHEPDALSFRDQPGETTAVRGCPFDLPDADVVLYAEVFTPGERAQLCEELRTTVAWTQERLRLYGQDRPLPRLTAWYGDEGAAYTYSHIAMQPRPWTATLRAIKTRVEHLAETPFNSVLLNLYRDGRDSVAWHQDNEPELGEHPVIASVSLGAARRFQLRHTVKRTLPPVDLVLPPGSLLLMRGETQRWWQHRLPKTAQPVAPRLNLTFRHVVLSSHTKPAQ